MPQYTFRCPTHGDFQVEQSMAATTSAHPCPSEEHYFPLNPTDALDEGFWSPKVLTATFHFPYGGRAVFHDGPEGDGQTSRATAKRWRDEFKESTGREAVGSARWV